MIKCSAEFYQGTQGKLFRLTRTPSPINAHIIYIAPLFEQANQTRHMTTRSAINCYQLGVQSVVFDHFGTGDSEGELIEATLTLWQQDIIAQIHLIKSTSQQPIFLSVLLSAALLLSDDILVLVDGLLLIQADFNGKSFIRQFKRMAIAGNLVKSPTSKHNAGSLDDSCVDGYVDIAGYQFTQQLFDELSKQTLKKTSKFDLPCIWFEWLSLDSELTSSRIKQQQTFQAICQHTTLNLIDDVKYWQAIELQLAPQCLQQEQQAILQLLDKYKMVGQG